jgi:cell division septation protein DedD
MASGEKKGNDFVLESRHLVGLFLLLVVIFGVVFTLGYLLGRNQYDTKLRSALAKPADSVELWGAPAAPPSERPTDRPAPPAGGKPDWEFYHAAEPKAVQDHLEPPKPTVATVQPTSSKPAAIKPAVRNSAAAHKPSSAMKAPVIPKGSITLQVAAVRHESDALALAQAIQAKKFPAFVLPPEADKLYHVQVGPYADSQSAGTARRELEAQGFKSITKR